MSLKIKAVTPEISTFDPAKAGEQFADDLVMLDEHIDWQNLTIDLTRHSSGSNFFVSAFFNSFWQELYDEGHEDPLEMEWLTDYRFQKRNIYEFAQAFKPKQLEPKKKFIGYVCTWCKKGGHLGLDCRHRLRTGFY